MKLRTVVNELACDAIWPARPELLDANVLLTPEYGSATPGDMLFVRLCRLEDWAAGTVSAGERELLLVHAGPKIPADVAPAGNVVLIAHPSSYEDLRVLFLDLPSRIAVLELLRERMFNAFLGSYDLGQYARRASEVLGNPVIILNSDQRVLATAGEFPLDALDVQEVLDQGYISETVNADMEADGIIEGVRRAHHSILALSARYGRSWVTSMVYYHHLEMGRFDVMEKDRAISGIDLELIDYASQLAGILIDRLGLAGERVGFGSSVLHDLVTGGFVNEKTMRAQLMVTHLPQDGSYAMLTLAGPRDADRDYLARVGSMVGRVVRSCLWCVEDGVLLEEKLPGLVRAGLDGVNISLDTLDRELFRRITGFDRLDDVKKGIKAALDSGVKVKLNTVIMEENRDCLTRLAELAKDEPLDVRFIEMMPIGEGQRYGSISGEGVFSELEEKYGRLEPCFDRIGSGPARYYSIDGFEGRVGFINAVHGAFCGSCNRIRLTSAGFLKTCLCYEDGADLKAAVRRGDLDEVRRLMAEAVKNKPKAHHFALGPAEGEGGMNRIGG